MFEKVNPSHPDKIADRIAGAVVDLSYKDNQDPRVACEVLIGHGVCHVIIETNVTIKKVDVASIIDRIAGDVEKDIVIVPQDQHLQRNQKDKIRCGDNGIFKGVPTNEEEEELSRIARDIYERNPYDGKYILDRNHLIVCQSNIKELEIDGYSNALINPLGPWTGGFNVDTGATNRKLGSDMGRAVTGGGIHGKDLSKADVSVNIFAHLEAQKKKKEVEYSCAIGDESIGDIPYSEIVDVARRYVENLGGFEALAEWGLI